MLQEMAHYTFAINNDRMHTYSVGGGGGGGWAGLEGGGWSILLSSTGLIQVCLLFEGGAHLIFAT